MRASSLLWGFGAPICVALIGLCVSCSIEETAHILGTRSQTPVFLSRKAVSTQEIEFRFSQPVQVRSFAADPPLSVERIEGGETVRVHLSGPIPGGEAYTVDLLVADEGGNTLNVLIPFRSRNDQMPQLIINELRTEYSGSTSPPRSEFVELKTQGTGNLGGLRLFITGNYKKPLVFEFPSADVATGEYIVLHLRTLGSDAGVANETGDNLGLSGGADAKPSARDFWIPGTDKLLHKTDVVYLLDQDDRVIDAVMLSENPDSWWAKDYFVEAADMLYQQDAWVSADGEIPSPVDAALTTNIKTSVTRSVSRDETNPDSDTQADWYITVTSGATPGVANNPNRFVD
jgi:hypothetical protein